MGGSILAQVAQRFGDTAPDCEDPAMLGPLHGALRTLVNEGAVVAYHDRADGGLAATASEMMFASRLGVKLDLTSLTKDADVFAALFNEELGGLMPGAGREGRPRGRSDARSRSCLRLPLRG